MDDKDYHDPRETTQEHQLTVVNREQLNITGVLHMDSFDEAEILLDTDLGALALRGEDLHIKQLDLDAGTLSVEGLINQIMYSPRRDAKGRAKGLIERLLR